MRAVPRSLPVLVLLAALLCRSVLIWCALPLLRSGGACPPVYLGGTTMSGKQACLRTRPGSEGLPLSLFILSVS